MLIGVAEALMSGRKAIASAEAYSRIGPGVV
jgi:hypothetical protein